VLPGIPFPVQGTFLEGINNSGQISGNYGNKSSLTYGLLLSHGQWTSFADPNAGTGPATTNPPFFPGTDAVKINDQGQIVGFYVTESNEEHSFVLSDGHFTTIDPPGAYFNPGPSFTNVDQAADINDLGQIVGGYTDSSNVTHGYLLSHGQYTTLDDPNASGGFTFANAINNSGQIVGFYFDSNGIAHGFLLSDGHYTTFNDPNAPTGNQGTFFDGINDSGQIVGYFVDAAGNDHGFVLSDGQYTALNDLNAGPGKNEGTVPGGINDEGLIVGFYADANFVAHGFLAIPVPFAAVGASHNPASGSGLYSAIGTANVLIAAPGNARSPGTPAGQAPAIVTVTSPLQSTVDPGVTLDDGGRALASRLVFGLKTY